MEISSITVVTPQQATPSPRYYHQFYLQNRGIPVVTAILSTSPLPCRALVDWQLASSCQCHVCVVLAGRWVHISWLCADVVSATEWWWPVSLRSLQSTAEGYHCVLWEVCNHRVGDTCDISCQPLSCCWNRICMVDIDKHWTELFQPSYLRAASI